MTSKHNRQQKREFIKKDKGSFCVGCPREHNGRIDDKISVAHGEIYTNPREMMELIQKCQKSECKFDSV